jgi:hypothetical protein
VTILHHAQTHLLPSGSTDYAAIRRKTVRDCPGIALALLP